MFTQLRTLLSQAKHRELTRQEGDQISERELYDLGLSREQLTHLLSLPADLPERVTAMAAVFGLTSSALQQNKAAWAEMLQSCGQCGARDCCCQKIAQPAISAAQAQGFCPNAQQFSARANTAPPAPA